MPIERKEYNENKLVLKLSGDKGNSFGPDILEELLKIFDDVEHNDDLVGIIITGEGRSFSVGGNVFAMHEAIEGGGAHNYLNAVVPLIEKLIKRIITFPKPVIAAVNGAAAGGGMSLALACDGIISDIQSKFGMAFGGLALSPDSGSSVLFADYFGRKEAIHGISTAKVYTAKELAERGIIQLVGPEGLIAESAELIDEKVSNSAYSYAKTKFLINQDIFRRLEHNLPLEYETIKEASSRAEFEAKVKETVERLTR